MRREELRTRTLAAFDKTFEDIASKIDGIAFDDLDDQGKDAVAYFIATGLIGYLASHRAPHRTRSLHRQHGEAVSQAVAPCFQVGANER